MRKHRPPSRPHGFELPDAFEPWLERWQRLLDRQERPREDDLGRHVRGQSGASREITTWSRPLDRAVEQGEYGAFHALVDVVSEPFTFPDGHAELADPPSPDERVDATFCGT